MDGKMVYIDHINKVPNVKTWSWYWLTVQHHRREITACTVRILLFYVDGHASSSTDVDNVLQNVDAIRDTPQRAKCCCCGENAVKKPQGTMMGCSWQKATRTYGGVFIRCWQSIRCAVSARTLALIAPPAVAGVWGLQAVSLSRPDYWYLAVFFYQILAVDRHILLRRVGYVSTLYILYIYIYHPPFLGFVVKFCLYNVMVDHGK